MLWFLSLDCFQTPLGLQMKVMELTLFGLQAAAVTVWLCLAVADGGSWQGMTLRDGCSFTSGRRVGKLEVTSAAIDARDIMMNIFPQYHSTSDALSLLTTKDLQ